MKKIKLISLLFLALFLFTEISNACTTAVISGKYTKDGRPMLWKHRDTWAVNNKIVRFDDGKYSCMGLVNSKDKKNKSIWIGVNDQGFAIMNSASYNLNNDTITQTGHEGQLMKRALQTCATVDDFEALLRGLPQPSRLEANFGVIDAQGGAAYFELANFRFTKFDANDVTVAPYGYIIRTNHSMSGKLGKGGGYIRYVTTQNVFDRAVKEGGISPSIIIKDVSRNLTNSFIKTDLNDFVNIPENTTTYVPFLDYVPRKGTSSSVVVEGVKKGENPALATMWTTLGWPVGSVMIPVWLTKDVDFPKLFNYDKTIKDAPLCNMALQLKDRCYPSWGYSSKYYININALINADNTGIIQLLDPLENEILDVSHKMLNKWRNGKIDKREMKNFYNNVDNKVLDFYQKTFDVTPGGQ